MFTVVREHELQRIHDRVRELRLVAVADDDAVDRPGTDLVQNEVAFRELSAQMVDATLLRHQWCGPSSCSRESMVCSAAGRECYQAEEMEQSSATASPHPEPQFFGQSRSKQPIPGAARQP